MMNKMKKSIRNIGILAHVDAGKTTITEHFLFVGGAKRTLGNVNKGTTTTDFLEVEKARGISVRAASTTFFWKDAQINLIDTPGHVDFSAEVERVLNILDGAILVVSAVEGVQSHTFTIYEALCELNIPTIIFINKIDRSGSDVLRVFEEINTELNTNLFPINAPINEGVSNATVAFFDENTKQTDDVLTLQNVAIETIAEYNDEILSYYLEGKTIQFKHLYSEAKKLFHDENFTPVVTGIAKEGLAIKELLDCVIDFIPTANSVSDEISGIVFKTEHDVTLGQIAHVRLFDGKLANRNNVFNYTQNSDEKISQIKKKFAGKIEDIGKLTAGDIGLITGMNALPGDIIGKPGRIKQTNRLNIAILTVRVAPKNTPDYAKLASALQELDKEDPTLNFRWFRGDKEFQLDLTGTIQMEILEILINQRFNIEVEFSEPTIIYKETPAKKAEGFVRYWMPKPCWAIMRFEVAPAEQGSGVSFESKVSTDKIRRKYQNEVERALPKSLEQGIKGWQVTDLKIKLVEGDDHEVHSNPGDFIIATPMGIMRALENSDTQLLEPILSFEIKALEEFLGSVASDLTTMRATFANPEFENGKFTIKGSVPAATSANYAIRLASVTGGRGKLKLRFSGYDKCPEDEGVSIDYKGVSPLDESKWILHARGAYKTNEWKIWVVPA